jgi:phytol kinase
MHAIVDFFFGNFPRIGEILVLGPPFLVWAAAVLVGAGTLKRRHGVRTAYTRKIFHIGIFATATIVQVAAGTRVLCLFGVATSLAIFAALWCGPGNLTYEAIARESDAPHRSWYVFVPYLATFLGGVSANILVGQAAIVGYLVTGLGDAIGEPVGARFGYHRYHPPGRAKAFTRSVEGSLAVLLTSTLAAGAGLMALGVTTLPALGGAAVFIGVIAAAVEAVSPHGWDNLPMQLLPSLLAAWWLA